MKTTIKITYLFVCLFLFCICITHNNVKAQNQPLTSDTLFSKGIRLENLGVTIPYRCTYAELKKLGNPVMTPWRKNRMHVMWDSVTVFYGITANIRISLLKKIRNEDSIYLKNFVIEFDKIYLEKMVENIKNTTLDRQVTRRQKKKKITYTKRIAKDKYIIMVHFFKNKRCALFLSKGEPWY